jgi:hypothetical protein
MTQTRPSRESEVSRYGVFVSGTLYRKLCDEGLTHLRSDEGVELLARVFDGRRKDNDYPALRHVVSEYFSIYPRAIAEMIERPRSLRILLDVDGLDSALSREVVEELKGTEEGRSAIKFIEELGGGNAEILAHYAASPFRLRMEAPTPARA